jgi:AraC family L-rhamnose operon transcriptional activator RhaR/AraC family L-rhamnose operon regulatory protein RhaS
MSGLSRRHFLRLFQQVYGTSPLQHLLDLRLQHAAALLNSTALPITRVAFESGFADSNYFTRQFTARYGVAPRKFRGG